MQTKWLYWAVYSLQIQSTVTNYTIKKDEIEGDMKSKWKPFIRSRVNSAPLRMTCFLALNILTLILCVAALHTQRSLFFYSQGD